MTIKTKALADSSCDCTIFHKIVANTVLNGDERNCVKILSNDQDLPGIKPLNVPVQFVTIETKALVDSGCACSILHQKVAYTVLNGDERNCVKILSNDQDLPGIEPLNVPVQFVTIETKALVDSGCACSILHQKVAYTVLNGDERNCVKILSNDQDLPGIEPLNVPVQFVTIETKALVDSGCACTIIYQNVANAVLNGDERNCVKVLPNDQDLPEIEPLNVPVHFVTIETKALVDSGCACTIFHKIVANAVKIGDERNCVKVLSSDQDLLEIEQINLPLQFVTMVTKALVVSGCACIIFPKNVANAVLNGDERSNWIKTPKKHDLEAFSNETVKIVGVNFTTRAAIGKLKMLTYNVNQVNFLSK